MAHWEISRMWVLTADPCNQTMQGSDLDSKNDIFHKDRHVLHAGKCCVFVEVAT